MTNAFASWIKRNGLTRHAVALALGLGDSAISKYCRVGHWPTLEVALRIYLFTGGEVSPNDMLVAPVEPQKSKEHWLAMRAIAETRQRREAKGNGKAKGKPRIAARGEQRHERRTEGGAVHGRRRTPGTADRAEG
jgi:transcriptional regulator with XRE-family HTH domain